MTGETRLRLARATQRKKDVLSVFMRRVAVTDLLVISWAVLSAQLLRFGPESFKAILSPTAMTPLELKYTVFSTGLIAGWLLMLRLDVARGYVAMAMPAGIFDLLVARWLWRKWLTMQGGCDSAVPREPLSQRLYGQPM